MPSKYKTFYIHIPKTAGTSINQHFRSLFPKSVVHLEGLKYDKKLIESYDYASGHIGYSQIKPLLDDSRLTLATFREPYSYVVSHLCWIRKLADPGEEVRFQKHPKVFQKISLKMKNFDFSDHSQITDFIDWLDEIDFKYLHNTQTLYLDHHKNIDRALVNLDSIDYIGIVDRIDDFLSIVNFSLGASGDESKAPIENINRNKYGFDISDARTKKALLPLIQKDITVYDAASSIFSNTFEKYQLALKAGLSCETFNKNTLTKAKGRLEGVFGGCATGWVKHLSSEDNQKITLDIYHNDNYLTSSIANEFSEEMFKRFRNDCAFTKLLPSGTMFEEGDKLSVRVKETAQLIDRKVIKETSENQSEGRLGGVYAGKVIGWARYTGKFPSKVAVVNILLNNKFLACTPADKYRVDINERFNQSCAFFYDIPKEVKLKAGDVLRARIIDSLSDLDNTSLILSKADFAKTEGNISSFQRGKLSGWAKMKYLSKHEPLSVDVFLNDSLLATVVADKKRDDLTNRFGFDCAFGFSLPDNIQVKNGDILRAKVTNEICDLKGSPYNVRL